MIKKKFKINLRNKQHRAVIIAVGLAVILITASIVLFSLFNKSYNDKEGNTPSNIINMGIASYEDGNLYYTKFDAGFKIFKLDINNGNEKSIFSANAKYINAFKGYIYFIDGNTGNIRKISSSGTEEQILYESICSHLYITNDWIYFIDKKENNSIYKMSMYDLSVTLVSEESAASIFVTDDYIFFTNYSDNNSIYRLDLQNNESISILSQHTIFFTVLQDRLYYTNINDESYIYSMTFDGKDNKRLENVKGWFLSSNPNDTENIYFKAANGSLKKVNINTLNQITISSDDCANINILDSYIIYLNQDNDNYYILDTLTGKSRILQ
ncbi:MAG TPA: DUF5050 domain-containing protein [Clostridia bacterium]|nr:DUF5050 domain-containing protein [Clostridia bacterium]